MTDYPVVSSSRKKYPQKRREVSPTKMMRRKDAYWNKVR
jgi:hypothetical protein